MIPTPGTPVPPPTPVPKRKLSPWFIAAGIWTVVLVVILAAFPQTLWDRVKTFIAVNYFNSDFIIATNQPIVDGNITMQEVKISKPGILIALFPNDYGSLNSTHTTATDPLPLGDIQNIKIKIINDTNQEANIKMDSTKAIYVGLYYGSVDQQTIAKDFFGTPILAKITILRPQ